LAPPSRCVLEDCVSRQTNTTKTDRAWTSQIAVGLIPALVIVGWIINQDLTLFFEWVANCTRKRRCHFSSKGNERVLSQSDVICAHRNFETIVLFVSVLLVDILVSDGRSHWLEGAQLSE
jgi:Ca2+:H+ antiporter